MNTVAHPDGQVFSATGRHPQGGRVAASSIDTMLSNELGREQLLPTVSVRFPSSYVGDNLDRRVVPLAIDDVGSISRTLSRAHALRRERRARRVTAHALRGGARSRAALDLPRRARRDGAPVRRRCAGCSASNLQDVFSAGGPAQGAPGARLQEALRRRPGGERRLRGRGDEAQPGPLRELRGRAASTRTATTTAPRRSSSRRRSISSPPS